MSVQIGLIWVQSPGAIIGSAGTMPWHLPEDLAHFKKLTLGSAVIMGRRTWQSLPARFRPLPGRRNIVVTRQPQWHDDGADVAHSIDAAIELAVTATTTAATTTTTTTTAAATEHIWVIGGAEIFEQIIDRAHRIEMTEIRETFAGDTRAPERGSQWMLTATDPQQGWHLSSSGLHYRFVSFDSRASAALA
ncbi:MAG: dihydrofolate reductase [Rhodoglobus sp.]